MDNIELLQLQKNGSGYFDFTAYTAIQNIEKERKKKMTEYTNFYRGDIVIVETNGKRGYNVIVSNNNMNYRNKSILTVSLTASADEPFCDTHVDIMLTKPSVALCERVWNVWKENVVEFIRQCTTEEMNAIDKALRIALGLCGPLTKAQVETAPAFTDEECRAMSAHIELLENENSKLHKENESLIEMNRTLEIMNDDLLKKHEDLMRKATEDHDSPDISALTAERDTYKAMYEKLLDKLIGA